MTEFKYYLTYPDRWALEDARFDLGNHAGNVIATYGGPVAGPQGITLEAWAPTRKYPNSEVTKAKIPAIYLLNYCRAISEQDARAIHPNLFRAIAAEGNKQN